MIRSRATIAFAVAFVALAVFAAAIPAASIVGRSPGSVLARLPQAPQVAETRGSAPRHLAIEKSSAAFPAVGAGRVRVVVESSAPAAAAVAIEGVGGRVERRWESLVQATLPRPAVARLEQARSVELVRAPMHMRRDAVSGEEVASSLAPAWHAKGLTGKGVKVAIIDGGFVGLADRQAAGDLPANAVTQDLCGGHLATADDHGTGVAEIVHEMAPDAQLYLICIETEVDLAVAVAYAKGQGVDVISHSASWFGTVRGDGTGFFGGLAADARAAGILWVNSAGNYAQTHWSGTFESTDGDRWHNFTPNDEGNTFVAPNNTVVCGFLRWDEWPAGISDFDLVLVDSATGEDIASSDDSQGDGEPAIEGLCVRQNSGSSRLATWFIYAYDLRSTPRMELFTFSPPLQYQTAAGSILEPATSPATLAVGAVCWQTRQPELFSSQGPTIDGRTKPDLAGHDSVSGATFGPSSGCPSGFAGTSASAPEVAGAAALVKQAFPGYGPDQVQQYLLKNARDMGAPGADSVTGAGELQLPEAPDVVPPTARALVSAGRAGRTVKLLSAVADDEGAVSVVEKVKRNGRVAMTIRRPGSVAAASPRTVATPWASPAKPKGQYQHCVVAIDKAGNRSPESCARIGLR